MLLRVAEMPALRDGPLPFPIVTGASAGALNGVAVAVGATDFTMGTRWLANVWRNLQPSDVFRTDLPSVTVNVVRWMRDLSFGGFLRGGHARFLLDASPLRHFLQRHMRVSIIQDHVDRGRLRALAVSATDYGTGLAMHFVQGCDGHPTWIAARHLAVRSPITADHLAASAAIPVIFPPVRLATTLGTSYFGDGCLRMSAPLGPAIRLGADRILAIGVRHRPTPRELQEVHEGPAADQPPSLAHVLGASLSAVFLDHLESDVEHLERINRLVASRATSDGEQMRQVDALVLTPSIHLGEIAEAHFHRMPALIRYLMGGLGVKNSHNADLISYLLFDGAYTRALLDAGYRDAAARIDEIEAFLFAR